VNGKAQYSLSLFNINGIPIKNVSIPEEITRWITWRNPAGFDFVLLSTKSGKLYAFEVFFMDLGSPLHRCGAELICMEYSERHGHIVAVTADGNLHLIPFLTASITKFAG
jgi:hypothetical protein